MHDIKNTSPKKITKLIIYSDFVCPFCYIAEQGTVSKLQKEFSIEIDWRGFELHPETPKGGVEIEAVFPKEQIAGMREYMKNFAKSFGVELGFSTRMSNTRRILAIAEYAREKEKLELFRNIGMHFYWKEGKNIEDTEVLKSIAQNAGLNSDEALMASESIQYLSKIDAIREDANRIGVTGIPTFFIENKSIVGCQSYEVFENTMNEFNVEKR